MNIPLKGKSLLDWYDDYTVLDIETTGLVLSRDEIIELSAVKVRSNLVVESFSSLVKPDHEIPDYITTLTGISNQMVENSPNIKQIITNFRDFLGDDILLGHNISFDINFINTNLLKYSYEPILNDYLDTLRLSRHVVSDVHDHRLETLSVYFSVCSPSHRGSDDCLSTHQVYIKIREKCSDAPIVLKSGSETSKEYHSKLNTIKPTEFSSENSDFIDNFFYNKMVVITGKLDTMSKFEAGLKIVNVGGRFSDSVNNDTNVLILGDSDYQQSMYGKKSSKHQKVEKMIQKGIDVSIIDETTFLRLISE